MQTSKDIGSRLFSISKMGKGDLKTKRGKIFKGTFGNCRPRKGKPFPKYTYTTPSQGLVQKSTQITGPRNWFKPKNYIHFSKQLTKSDLPFIEGMVKDPVWVSNYCFYPLIHRVIYQRRYKKCSDGKKAFYDKEKGISNTKARHIFYANHLDSAIYAYYAKEILGPRYEQKLEEDRGLSDCVSAYRKLVVKSQPGKGKSNIHFAKEVFDYIKEQPECVAIAFDITGFFDNLVHKNLQRVWANLLGEIAGYLGNDHYNIFKSLTRFSYVEEISLLKMYNLQAINNPKKRMHRLSKLKCYSKGKNKNRFFRTNIAQKLIVSHAKYEKEISKGSDKGIPQGTPLSALLSNIYMLEFDKKIQKKVQQIGGFYRRYSDDIMVVCSAKFEKEVSAFVLDLIRSPEISLEINHSKTERAFFYKNEDGQLQASENPIKYLGFEFDGKRTLIKSSALAKYHRRKKYFVKRKVRKTKEMAAHVNKDQKLWTKAIWRKYSAKGRRNFLSYVERAASIIDDRAILRQLRNHKKQLSQYINKHNKH